MSELIGHPSRERNSKAVDDRHDVIWNADRFVWHVRIIHTDNDLTDWNRIPHLGPAANVYASIHESDWPIRYTDAIWRRLRDPLRLSNSAWRHGIGFAISEGKPTKRRSSKRSTLSSQTDSGLRLRPRRRGEHRCQKTNGNDVASRKPPSMRPWIDSGDPVGRHLSCRSERRGSGSCARRFDGTISSNLGPVARRAPGIRQVRRSSRLSVAGAG